MNDAWPVAKHDIDASGLAQCESAPASSSQPTQSASIEIRFSDQQRNGPSHRARTAAQPIPPRPSFSLTDFLSGIGGRGGGSTLNDQGAELPQGQGDFFGPGSVLKLGRFAIRSPLVYATASAAHLHSRYQSVDASLIDGSLPAAPAGSTANERLPYWPSYSGATPEQRASYLNWLVTGRRNPDVELGYVFIFFYGLERRTLIDVVDHAPIIEELLRLRQIYCYSRSFDRYSASLIWVTIALAGRASAVDGQLLEAAIASVSRWDEDLLTQCLAYYQVRGLELPAEVAFQIAKADSRTPSSVIVRRQEARFKELFLRKYVERFGPGMDLKASKRNRPCNYHAASATLHEATYLEHVSLALLEIPNVLGISSQFKPLVEIWEQCIGELRAYDKASRTSGGKLTAEAYESLPRSLRTGEHPEFDRWLRLWEEKSNADGLPVVPIAALAILKGIAQRATLLKTQCVKLLTTADSLGIGVEPDMRLSGKNYRWDEQVVLFFKESEGEENAATYQAAVLLLELGMYIASADGQVDASELALIARQLENQFTLSPDEFKRLECSRQLLALNPPKEARVTAAVRNRLSKQQRQLVGEYLVGVAAADQVISPQEMSALRRLYVQLDLEPSDLEALLAPMVATKPVEAPKQVVTTKSNEFRLDLRAVSRIMSETKEVARILQEAMEAEEDERVVDSVSSPADSELDTRPGTLVTDTAGSIAVMEQSSLGVGELEPHALGLDQRYRPFLAKLVAQPSWTLIDARELAKSHHVMLNGAIEAINEWSQEQFGDWLIEEGDLLVVHSEILRK